MCRKRHQRVFGIFASGLLSIAAVFRSQNLLLLEMVVVDIRPPTVVSLINSVEGFSRKFGALLRIVELGVQLEELIPSVLSHKQLVKLLIPIETNDVAKAGRIALSIRIGLLGL